MDKQKIRNFFDQLFKGWIDHEVKKRTAYRDCHYYEPKQEDFEACPVYICVDSTWECLTEHCIACPYNPFTEEATISILKGIKK